MLQVWWKRLIFDIPNQDSNWNLLWIVWRKWCTETCIFREFISKMYGMQKTFFQKSQKATLISIKLINYQNTCVSTFLQRFVSKSDGRSNFSHLKGRWALINEMVWRVFWDFLEYLRTQLIPTTTYFQCAISHPRIPNFEKFSAARVVQYFKAW